MSLKRKILKAKSKRASKDMAFDAIVARGIQIAKDSGLDVSLGEITDKGFSIAAMNAEDSYAAREIVGKHITDTMSGKFTGIVPKQK